MCLKDYFLLIVLQLIICLIKTTNIMLQRKFDENTKHLRSVYLLLNNYWSKGDNSNVKDHMSAKFSPILLTSLSSLINVPSANDSSPSHCAEYPLTAWCNVFFLLLK